MLRLHPEPEVYLFLLWSEARYQERRIMDDLAAHFTLLDLVEVSWSTDDTFSSNLSRMYGDALPPDSDKERHCGTGPFLVAVVQDERPRLRVRHTGRGRRLQNSCVYDARLRYRRWTGGGYRVHASDSIKETERNLALLLGTSTAEVAGRRPAGVRRHDADPVGTHGWDSVEQLLSTLRPYGNVPVGPPQEGRLVLESEDVWWAELLAGGEPLGEGVRQVSVAGKPLQLVLLQQPRLEVRLVNAAVERARKAVRARVRS